MPVTKQQHMILILTRFLRTNEQHIVLIHCVVSKNKATTYRIILPIGYTSIGIASKNRYMILTASIYSYIGTSYDNNCVLLKNLKTHYITLFFTRLGLLCS
jgi:hypothetical protein